MGIGLVVAGVPGAALLGFITLLLVPVIGTGRRVPGILGVFAPRSRTNTSAVPAFRRD
jgi:hypothetical protein